MNQARPLVSLLVVAYQAAACLPDLLADLRAQDYPAEALEAVLVDGLSPDGTKALMLRFAATAPMPVRVLDNPGRSLACGCNVALAASRGDLLVRLDAHARIPSDFITRNVEAMTPDRDIVGGKVEAFSPHTPWEAVLVALDTSRFAGGAAAFRNAGRLRAVDTLAYAMYRRRVYDTVGLYDTRLWRTEDNDMHCRMRAAGYTFYFVPGIVSQHTARRTLRAQLAQKWGNGRWVGLTMGVQPLAFAPRHFAPAAFVLALLGCTGVALAGFALPLIVLACAYGLCALGFAATAARRTPIAKSRTLICLPLFFLVVHLAYGAGTITGLFGAKRVARGGGKARHV